MRSSARLLAAGLVATALFAAMSSGCVTSPGGGGGGGSVGGGGGSNPVVLKLDGRDARADEVFKSPVFRTALRQWAAIEHIKQSAAAEGVTVDAAEVQEKLDEQKTQMEQSGMVWEDMLQMQGMTEEEVVQMMEFQMLSEAYAKKKAGEISDEDLQEEWTEREQFWRDSYAAQNFLPETRKAELTFDEVKDWLREQLASQNSMTAQQTMFTDALKELQLEVPSLGNKEQQAKWLDLIIKSAIPADPEIEEETPDVADEIVAPETGAEGESAADVAPGAEAAPPAEGTQVEGGQ